MSLLTPPRLDGWTERQSGLLIPEPARPKRDRPVAVELFAGCGGMALGFHQAGWHVAAAVEYDLTAATTYLCNLGDPDTVIHVDDPKRCKAWDKLQGDETRRWAKAGAPEGFGGAGTGWITMSDHAKCTSSHGDDRCFGCHWSPDRCGCARCVDAQPCEHFWIADVRNLTGQEILDALGMQPGEVDAVTGGPPCQGFSTAGKRNVMDPRNSLVFEFGRLVLEIQPKTMVMENVPGIVSMLTPEGVPVLDAFALTLAEGGWSTYESLKRTLAAQGGVFGAVRGTPSSAESETSEDAPPDDPQLDLFSEAAS